MKRLTRILLLNFALLLVWGCGSLRHDWESLRPITAHSKYSEKGLGKRFLYYDSDYMRFSTEMRHSFPYRDVYVTFPAVGFSELEKIKELRKRAKPFAAKKCLGQSYFLDNFVSSKAIRIFIGADIVCSKESPAENRRKQEKDLTTN